MDKNRLLNFSDGFIAIAITLIVFQIKMPDNPSFRNLIALAPSFTIYLLTFFIIAVHWVNHHYLFEFIQKVNLKMIWANLHFLFWISTLPLATSWIGKYGLTEKAPIAFYAFIMLTIGLSYKLITKTVLSCEEGSKKEIKLFCRGRKDNIILFFNLLAVILAFFYEVLAFIILVIVKIVWFVMVPVENYNTRKKVRFE